MQIQEKVLFDTTNNTYKMRYVMTKPVYAIRTTTTPTLLTKWSEDEYTHLSPLTLAVVGATQMTLQQYISTFTLSPAALFIP